MSRTFLLLLISIIFATGCSSVNETEKLKPIRHQEKIGELAYEIKLNKNHFGMNDEIVVYTKITNHGKETLNYVSGSSTCPNHAIVDIVHQDSSSRLAIQPSGDCTLDLGKSKLEPGQVVEDKWIFIPSHYSKSGLQPALNGTYDVQIALPPEDNEITEDYQSLPINPRPSAKTQIILSELTGT